MGPYLSSALHHQGLLSVPLIMMPDLSVTLTLRAFACHSGMRETDAPVSSKTVVDDILWVWDFAGTLLHTIKL